MIKSLVFLPEELIGQQIDKLKLQVELLSNTFVNQFFADLVNTYYAKKEGGEYVKVV
jgi:hypothetical protein